MYLMEEFSQQILCPKGDNITTFPSLVFSLYNAMFNGGISARGAKGVLMVTYNYNKKQLFVPNSAITHFSSNGSIQCSPQPLLNG